MTDEEKEAIEIVKGITEDDLLNYWEGAEEPYNAIQTILNLIEKQQKEIEELKEKNEYLPAWVGKKYVSKDKIKAKIEDLKLECENCPYQGELCDELNSNNNCVPGMTILILQSLLEKE